MNALESSPEFRIFESDIVMVAWYPKMIEIPLKITFLHLRHTIEATAFDEVKVWFCQWNQCMDDLQSYVLKQENVWVNDKHFYVEPTIFSWSCDFQILNTSKVSRRWNLESITKLWYLLWYRAGLVSPTCMQYNHRLQSINTLSFVDSPAHEQSILYQRI